MTTPTVKTPNSRANSATTGAAPVPVPPPIPAVINTMSEPFKTSIISSRLSNAAWRPISGLPPPPKPPVKTTPNCISLSEFILLRACTSVLAQTNCTPCK